MNDVGGEGYDANAKAAEEEDEKAASGTFTRVKGLAMVRGAGCTGSAGCCSCVFSWVSCCACVRLLRLLKKIVVSFFWCAGRDVGFGVRYSVRAPDSVAASQHAWKLDQRHWVGAGRLPGTLSLTHTQQANKSSQTDGHIF